VLAVGAGVSFLEQAPSRASDATSVQASKERVLKNAFMNSFFQKIKRGFDW
jgi:hypothetical protein